MNKLVLIIVLVLSINGMNAQSIFGKWKTIDDETGKEKSIVEIYEKDGKVYGKIIELINPKQKNPLCSKCDGSKKDKPVLGMVIIESLEKDDDVYNDGTILNPENGKVYSCRLKLDDEKDTLQVRGYVAFFYKTQYWKRASE
ncbi:DUF2147 domain-containing protein [Winogradskyella flava]|uniref:DUF2147 domain-containing protein n=1 Tax=Winogradskyella flava TaxID=1884876 RepID=A0A842IWU6_9FLAO|nr:DUF2147 domain-containing protein [Winogradskyella flava]MBC2846163.1 DUF2147 domain-containing protein [Winogradskyella flava]